MATKDPKDIYPGPRTVSEAGRLHIQGTLCAAALGGLVLCPIDLTRPGLRILDSGTADGNFLRDIRKHLAHPDDAELIGTDIAPFPDAGQNPPNLKLLRQNILEDWPEEWNGTFDFVHQRTCLSVAGGFDGAVSVVQRLVKLVKPGGWIQIVDGLLPKSPYEDSDKSSMRMFKTLAHYLTQVGLNSEPGPELADVVTQAGGLEDVETKSAIGRLGKGAQNDELYEMGFEQIRLLGEAAAPAFASMPDHPVGVDGWNDLVLKTLDEAHSEGVDMYWYAVWGRKPL